MATFERLLLAQSSKPSKNPCARCGPYYVDFGLKKVEECRFPAPDSAIVQAWKDHEGRSYLKCTRCQPTGACHEVGHLALDAQKELVHALEVYYAIEDPTSASEGSTDAPAAAPKGKKGPKTPEPSVQTRRDAAAAIVRAKAEAVKVALNIRGNKPYAKHFLLHGGSDTPGEASARLKDYAKLTAPPRSSKRVNTGSLPSTPKKTTVVSKGLDGTVGYYTSLLEAIEDELEIADESLGLCRPDELGEARGAWAKVNKAVKAALAIIEDA